MVRIIADKGFIGADYRNELYKFTGIDLQTAARSNMKAKRSKKFIKSSLNGYTARGQYSVESSLK